MVPGCSKLTARDSLLVFQLLSNIFERRPTRIFNRFERAVSPRNYGGLGLGLYISAQILRAHGGSLRVESEPGQGACFIVELPRNRAPEDYPRPQGDGASPSSLGWEAHDRSV